MCEYCEPSMLFGNGGVSVGTRAIIDGNGEDEPRVYVMDGFLYLEYESVVENRLINSCPMCGRNLRSDA